MAWRCSALFVALQARLREPLMRLGIFRTPNLAASNVAQFLLGAAWIPMWFFLNLYLQQVLGLGAFASGAALLPMTVTDHGRDGRAVAPRLIARFGPKSMTVAGLATPGRRPGLAVVRPRPTAASSSTSCPASPGGRRGHGAGVHPVARAGPLQRAAPEEGGLASGIVSTSYQVGSALGLAAMTAVASAFGADQVGDVARPDDGFSAALLGAAGIAAAGGRSCGRLAALAHAGGRSRPRQEPAAVA